jgi:integrase/recombinase XerD
MNDPYRVRVTGPLAGYAEGFREQLAAWGYTNNSTAAQLHVVAHLSRWLAEQGLDVTGLTPEHVEQFAEQRRREGRNNHISSSAVDPLLDYLRGAGLVAVVATQASGPVDELLGRYHHHLVAQRGLAELTVEGYEQVASRFLASWKQPDSLRLDTLTAADVVRWVSLDTNGLKASSVKAVATGLRSLLRFLYVEAETARPLAEAVPAGPVRRDSALPAALPPSDVQRLLRSCDRRRAMGRRDYAILMLLARLGLRSGEVAGLELDDIDWRNGEILIRGRGGRQEPLPLPTDVGEALVGYLRRGRPSTESRRVFVRVCAPHHELHRSSIGSLVARRCERAGLPRVGPHRLRHTVATELLRHGASLSDIGQVLRHRSGAETTAIYAKVDHSALQTLAQPWPGGGA